MDWRTHDISNQIPEHSNYNLLASDVALTEALDRTAAWSSEQLTAFGGRLGREETFDLPGVGENLLDHCVVSAFSAETAEHSTRGVRTEAHLFMRSSDAVSSPDIQVLLTPVASGLPSVPPSKGFSSRTVL